MVTRGAKVAAMAATAALLAMPCALAAQSSDQFVKGSRVASVGVLLGGGNDGVGLGGLAEWGVMPIAGATLGVGGFAGFQRESAGVGSLRATGTAVYLMGTGNVHFPVASQPRLDLYAGASFGFVRSGVKFETSTANQSEADVELGLGLQGGARYKVAPKLSVFGQLGVGDLPMLSTGVSFRF